MFKYWYNNQTNTVRWMESFSEPFKMECGVRQGGLSCSKLFNLYINSLIEELSSTHVGCHIDDVCVNNMSYADDMVLAERLGQRPRNSASVCCLAWSEVQCRKKRMHGL